MGRAPVWWTSGERCSTGTPKVSGALEKALQDQHGIGLSEFETLDRLVDANCGSYRMNDLLR